MLNLGLAFGGSIQRAAQQHGASVAMMSNAVWLPCLYAGSIPGAIYCYYLMKQKKTLSALIAGRDMVLLACLREHGPLVVWQHHSLQHFNCKTRGSGTCHWVASLSWRHCYIEHRAGSGYGRMVKYRQNADQDHDPWRKLPSAGNRNSQLRRQYQCDEKSKAPIALHRQACSPS